MKRPDLLIPLFLCGAAFAFFFWNVFFTTSAVAFQMRYSRFGRFPAPQQTSGYKAYMRVGGTTAMVFLSVVIFMIISAMV